MVDIREYLAQRRAMVDAALEARMPPADTRPAVLHEAMRYSVAAGGKRLRPIICLAAAEAIGAPVERALLPALAIEILHTYTLIHDDLPCMDDSGLRRGRPTCHVAYGEANALLAGDALLTLAFEWLAEAPAPAPYPPGQIALELARAAGGRGVVGGQVEDLAAEQAQPDANRLEFIHIHKTAVLFQAAACMGAVAGGARPDQYETLARYGRQLGLAFQIIDDLLDATATERELGKPAGHDREQGKLTYVAVHGLAASRARSAALIAESASAARALGPAAEPLVALAESLRPHT